MHQFPQNFPWPLAAVLFDLDGTLLDSAPDLANAANVLRQRRNKIPLPLNTLRPFVSQGARGLLKQSFNITPEHDEYPALQKEFLDYYQENLCVDSQLFSGTLELISFLKKHNILWGIVTNKHSRFTQPLTTQLGLDQQTHCIVSGDTTPHAKPHPAPLLHAAEILQVNPINTIYVGDDHRDILAAKAAGMFSIACQHGYLGDESPIQNWEANYIVKDLIDLTNTLENWLKTTVRA